MFANPYIDDDCPRFYVTEALEQEEYEKYLRELARE